MAKLRIVAVLFVCLFSFTSSANAEPRIVGGQPTAEGEWRFVAGLYSMETSVPFCTGSLINEKWVLTASHCVEDIRVSNTYVVVGRRDLASSEGQSRAVETAYIYPEAYANRDFLVNDLALLKLKTPSSKTPVTISKQTNYQGAAQTAGYGVLNDNGDGTSVLRETNLEVISKEECNSRYSTSGLTSDVMSDVLCTFSQGHGPCYGDSGGPLLDHAGLLIGITSSGMDCAKETYPDLYVNAPLFKSWIDKTISNGYAEEQIRTLVSDKKGKNIVVAFNTSAPLLDSKISFSGTVCAKRGLSGGTEAPKRQKKTRCWRKNKRIAMQVPSDFIALQPFKNKKSGGCIKGKVYLEFQSSKRAKKSFRAC